MADIQNSCYEDGPFALQQSYTQTNQNTAWDSAGSPTQQQYEMENTLI
jgi:hypothetical protein